MEPVHFEGAGLFSKRPAQVKAGSSKKLQQMQYMPLHGGKVCVGVCVPLYLHEEIEKRVQIQLATYI